MERKTNQIAIFLDDETMISRESLSTNGEFLGSSATFVTEKFGQVEVQIMCKKDQPSIVLITSEALRSRTSKSIERGLPVADGVREVYVDGYLNGSQDIGLDPKTGKIQRLRVEGWEWH